MEAGRWGGGVREGEGVRNKEGREKDKKGGWESRGRGARGRRKGGREGGGEGGRQGERARE